MFRKSNFASQEEELRFKVNAAPSSDSHIESLLQKRPGSHVLQTYYTANAQARQDWPEALRRAEKFRSRSPKAGVAWTLTIDTLRNLKRDDEAKATMQEALRRLPRDWNVLRHAAMTAGAQGDWAEAARLLDRCRRHYPRRLESYTDGANARARAGDQDGAAALLAEARTRFPDSIAPWITEANLAELAGATQDALDLWKETLEHFPLGWEAYLGKARLLQTSGRPEEALDLLRQATSYFPENQRVAEALKKMEPPAIT